MPTNEPARHTVSSFEHVVPAADDYRMGRPVVVEVTAERDVGRRIVDFFSGLAYGTDGSLEKVAEAVYLVSPNS